FAEAAVFPFDDAQHARIGQLPDDRAGAMPLVRDQHHPRGIRRGMNHPADQPLGGDDRLVLSDAGKSAAINADGIEPLVGVAPDHLRRDLLERPGLLQVEQRFQTGEPLLGLLRPGQVGFELRIFGAQRLILLPRVAEREIVFPDAADAPGGVGHDRLGRGKDGQNPDLNKAPPGVPGASPSDTSARCAASSTASKINGFFLRPSVILTEGRGRRSAVVCPTAGHCFYWAGNVVLSQPTRRSRSKSDSIAPAPSTTDESGSSAIETGNPVSCISRTSSFLSSAPPPVSTMPRSTMSADNSGGVRSSATRTALTIVATESASASRISSSVTTMVFGMPSIRFRPLISIVNSSSSGAAEPTSILICSAVRSPISRLYLRLMYCVTASSISLPATRTLRE